MVGFLGPLLPEAWERRDGGPLWSQLAQVQSSSPEGGSGHWEPHHREGAGVSSGFQPRQSREPVHWPRSLGGKLPLPRQRPRWPQGPRWAAQVGRKWRPFQSPP